jgi:hypothetical protein
MIMLGALLVAIALDQPVPVATCSMCHALPSKRLQATRHGFILEDEDLTGCETCHGPGLAHVESEGGRGTITNPRHLAATELDGICEKCHADVVGMRGGASGVHSGPQPCSACHVVHNPGVEPRLTKGGRDRGQIEDTPLGTASADSLAAAGRGETKTEDPNALDLGIGMRLRGSITAGVRFVDVSGNDEVFDQDVNLDGGFRLLDAQLHGVTTDPNALFDRIDLGASGVDDPVSTYRFDLAKDRHWTWTSGFRKQSWVYEASGDFHHPYDVKREETFADLSVDAADRVKVFAGWDLLRRSGDTQGSSFFDGTAVPVDRPVDQTSNRAHVGATVDFGPCDVTAEQELRWFRNDDTRLLLAGSPPLDQFLDLRTQRRELTPVTTLRFHTAPLDGKVDFSVRGRYAHTDADVDVSQDRRSLGMPTAQSGDADVTRNFAALESALTLAVRDDLSLSTTGAISETRESGSVHVDESSPGIPPRTFLDDRTSVFERDVRVSEEALYSPIRELSLRAGWESEFADVRIDTQDRPLTVDTGGPIAGVRALPWKRLSIDATYRRADTDDPFTVVGPETQDRVRTRVRYTSDSGWFVAPEWTRSTARNHDTDTRVDATTIGASTGWSRDDSGHASASYFWRSYRTRSDTSLVFEGARQIQGVGYSNREHRFLLEAGLDAAKPFHLEGDAEVVFSDGDFPFAYDRLVVRPNVDLSWNWNVFLEVSFTRFAETGASVDDYDAYLYLAGATYRF